jgi:hypothetical protein
MNKRYRDRIEKPSRAIRRGPVPPVSEALRFPWQPKVHPGPAKLPSLAARVYACLVQSIQRLTSQYFKRRRRRKLQLLEIQQLGEKRFVAVVRFGKQKFLIGGAATSVSLLAEIHSQRAAVITPRPLSQESA